MPKLKSGTGCTKDYISDALKGCITIKGATKGLFRNFTCNIKRKLNVTSLLGVYMGLAGQRRGISRPNPTIEI